MRYVPLDDVRNEIRVLSFVLSSKADNSETLDCIIGNVSIDQYHPDFEKWVQKAEKFLKFSIPVADAHARYRGWKDAFSKHIDDRERNLLGRVALPLRKLALPSTELTLSSTNPGPRFVWGDFEALSYSWGEDNMDGRVRLNGVESSISRNLEAALRALRVLPETQSGMRYWVDALSINQMDTNERNHQVKRMQEIYAKARATVVWLGNERDLCDTAIDIIYRYYRLQSALIYLPLVSKDYAKTLIDIMTKWTLALWSGAMMYNGIRSWICLYWQRAWIVQEVASNHNATLFMCGEKQLTHNMLKNAVYFCQRHIQVLDGRISSKTKQAVGQHSDVWTKLARADTLLRLVSRPSQKPACKEVLDLARRLALPTRAIRSTGFSAFWTTA